MRKKLKEQVDETFAKLIGVTEDELLWLHEMPEADFDKLVRKHRPLIRTYARSLCTSSLYSDRCLGLKIIILDFHRSDTYLIRQLAKDPSWFVRSDLMEDAWQLPEKLAIQLLVNGTTDRHYIVRRDAYVELAEIAPELVEIEKWLKKETDPQGIAGVLMAMLTVGRNDLEPWLSKHLVFDCTSINAFFNDIPWRLEKEFMDLDLLKSIQPTLLNFIDNLDFTEYPAWLKPEVEMFREWLENTCNSNQAITELP